MFVVENRPDESFFSRLDSNLKKNTAFVKKLVSLLDYLYISVVNSMNLEHDIMEKIVEI